MKRQQREIRELQQALHGKVHENTVLTETQKAVEAENEKNIKELQFNLDILDTENEEMMIINKEIQRRKWRMWEFECDGNTI